MGKFRIFILFLVVISTTSQKVLPQGTNQSQTVEYDKTSKILHTVTESFAESQWAVAAISSM